jgi:hypothetical protein
LIQKSDIANCKRFSIKLIGQKRNTEFTLSPCSFVLSVTRFLITSARRRDNAIHSQVLHHLAVFVSGMNDRA